MKKFSLLSLLAASALLLSSCSSVLNSGYLGYKKNEIKFGKGVTKQFQRAVFNSNVEWLEEIITNYPELDVNYYGNNEIKYQGFDYETLKVICVENSISYVSEDKMLRYLMENGLDPNLKFSNGHYALDKLCADYNYRPFLVKTLLENGADPNNASSAGFYNTDLGDSNKTTLYLPIYWAIYKPAFTNAEDLLEHGAEVSYKILDEIHGINSVIEGSAKPYQLAFKSYIEKTGESPFTKAEEYAILGESDKLIEELKSGEELDDEAAATVKYYICRFCSASSMKAWDEAYSERKISKDNYKIMEPGYQLDAAAYEGNYEIVKYLFNEGLIDFSINTALENAAQAGSSDVCKFLLENGKLEEEFANRYTKFLIAAFQGKDADTFRIIADYFSKRKLIDEIDIGYIFSDQIVEWNSFTKAVIDCLTDDCGYKLNGFKCSYIDYKTMKYLFDKGKPLSVFDLQTAIVSHDMKLVRYILDKGADPNQCIHKFGIYRYDEKHNEKILLPYEEALAALEGDKEALSAVYSYVETSGCIKYAIRYGISEIVQLLIDYGANLSDESILACAITDSSKATFDVLFNAGASLDYRNDEDKETLVDVAKKMGRDDIVKILKKAGVKAY